jgi:DNA-binding transcriptional ArsR family regulator
MVEQVQLDAVSHALADATRRAILRAVSEGEKSVGDLAGRYPISLAAVSKHLDVLERAALIERKRRGTSRLVSLKPRALQTTQQWFAYYEQFWSGGLDRFQALLETPEAGKQPALPLPSKPKSKEN